MEETVYVDILIAINFIVDYFLLRLTALLAGSAVSGRRLVFSAAVSSLTSLCIFLPPLPAAVSVLRNLLFSAGISALAFGVGGGWIFFCRTVVFYGVNLVYAGGMLLLCWRMKPKGLLFWNGVLYFRMSPVLLIGMASVLYGGVKLFHFALGHGRIAAKSCRVRLAIGGKQLELSGYLDTGNHARDGFTGKPVVFCAAPSLQPVIGEEGVRWFRERDYLKETQTPPAGLKLRLLPFSGIGGESVLPAFVPDGLWIYDRDTEKWLAAEACAAVTPTPFREGYDILLHPELGSGANRRDCPKDSNADQQLTAKGRE